ncbi:cytochrome c maturation protein CcmE [Sorangium sp. So ce131]|uniref:cytochrome c maturation protein CcmE n=1 Tax=Sorangium sp. So ce131 TaxID=3133282 RepID=UPI003F6111F7
MSKKLDEELAQALSLAEQQETPAVVKPAASAPPKPRPSRSIGLLATLLVMVGALVALFLVGFKEAAVYATPVDQLLTSKDKLTGRKVRVEGELVPGTLVKRDSPCEYRFQIHGTQAALPVRYAQCVIPDTFRDVPSGGVQVTVEGALTAEGNFEASLVMAKCTSKYDPNSHEMKGGAEGPLSSN